MKGAKKFLSIFLAAFILALPLLPMTALAAGDSVCLLDIARPTSQKGILFSTNIGSFLETLQGNNYERGFYIGSFAGYGRFDNYTFGGYTEGSMVYDLNVSNYTHFSVALAPSRFWGATKNGFSVIPKRAVAGTVKFYVDGKEVRNVTVNSNSNDIMVDINLAGARKFRIVGEGLSVVFGDPYFYTGN